MTLPPRFVITVREDDTHSRRYERFDVHSMWTTLSTMMDDREGNSPWRLASLLDELYSIGYAEWEEDAGMITVRMVE